MLEDDFSDSYRNYPCVRCLGCLHFVECSKNEVCVYCRLQVDSDACGECFWHTHEHNSCELYEGFPF